MHCVAVAAVAVDTVVVVVEIVDDSAAAVGVDCCTVLVDRNRPYRNFLCTAVVPFPDVDVDAGIGAAVL